MWPLQAHSLDLDGCGRRYADLVEDVIEIVAAVSQAPSKWPATANRDLGPSMWASRPNPHKKYYYFSFALRSR